MLSDQGRDHLKKMLMRDEGVRYTLYHCPAGYPTIGVGRNLEAVGLRPSEVSFMLNNDIDYFYNKLSKECLWFNDIGEVRQMVLVNMAFNLGLRGLLSFKNMIQAIKLRKWDEAAEQMLDSKYARQVGDRAKRLAEQLATGKTDKILPVDISFGEIHVRDN